MVSVFSLEKDWISNETLKLFTDSSGNPELGCGVYFNGLWAQLRWPFDEKYVIPRNGSCGSCYVSMGYFSREQKDFVLYR
jgi:hypothetical protein